MKHKRTLLILAGIIFLFLLQLLLLHRLSPLLSRDGIAYETRFAGKPVFSIRRTRNFRFSYPP